MTLFQDPIDRPEVQVRRDAWPTEVKAAEKALGRSGSTRAWAFEFIARRSFGATAVEVAYAWAKENPCDDCGCTHLLPIPVNQWGTRLGELRDAGVVVLPMGEDGEPMERTYRGRPGLIHVVSGAGREAWHARREANR